MADPQKLKRFHIEQDDDAFVIKLEDEAGGSFSVSATHDQIDLILDSLDDALDADEEAEEAEDDEGEGDAKA
ncbi:hypothetical protein P7D22_16675 [Lichenihabitans sp. Uapishka_5]|uniref:hypothetical protein n=1 Tax=Lichenihabitans sp. Uapishka_5 TaxID=3037302 RepID=UPI0029E7DC04|nr:hypothetical protein [Lichenihabitans sp. Uapishka_5]MDX7952804.1 hypothetical protein [Lichenihabitans sp. Uapishka_5]